MQKSVITSHIVCIFCLFGIYFLLRRWEYNPVPMLAILLLGEISSVFGFMTPTNWIARAPAILWFIIFTIIGSYYIFGLFYLA